jgi:hypothetical protein
VLFHNARLPLSLAPPDVPFFAACRFRPQRSL